MSISLGIPTYNSSKYLWDCIKTAINCDFIGEIVIHDDGSNPSEYGNICKILNSLNTDKIRICRSEINQKAFINKYFTVANCKSEWVYLFDSDNWFDECILDRIKNLDYSKTDTCYIGSKLLMTDGNITEYNYEDKIFDLNVTKKYIESSMHKLSWFLNSGNFIVNREQYLTTQQKFFMNFPYHANVDVLLFSFYWLTNGNKYEIVDDWYHHHRIRPGNYFMENGGYENIEVIRNIFSLLISS